MSYPSIRVGPAQRWNGNGCRGVAGARGCGAVSESGVWLVGWRVTVRARALCQAKKGTARAERDLVLSCLLLVHQRRMVCLDLVHGFPWLCVDLSPWPAFVGCCLLHDVRQPVLDPSQGKSSLDRNLLSSIAWGLGPWDFKVGPGRPPLSIRFFFS